MKKFFLLLVIILALFYRQSFAARFFQDDFLLLKLARSGDIFTPIANFPYRPIAIQIFFGINLFLFGENPVGFHFVLFVIFVATLWFALQIAKNILKDEFAAKVATVIFAFNISLFPLFYWVAVSYFVLAAFFIFSSIYFLLKNRKVLSGILFIFGLLSNELVIILPLLLLTLKLVAPLRIKDVFLCAGISAVYLFIRAQITSLPVNSDYALVFGLQTIATARWYFLRIFNLPEGRAAAGPLIYGLLILSLGPLLLAAKNFKLKFAFFGLFWFIVGALPFFFLPYHMSSYYLTISLFGPAVFSSSLIGQHRKLTVFFLIFYLLLSFFGLEALSRTHWIILKP